MQSPVETIKERLNIVDVISTYISVEQTGNNYKAKCPFHNEKTASFFISPSRNSYYCFGCGAKGDIFSFVEHFEGTDFLGALKLLAERAGVSLAKNNHEKSDNKSVLYEILEEATKFFEATFASHPEARTYLKGRGLTDETIKNFRIGYVKNEWRTLSDYLLSKGYKKSDLETVGLIKTKDNSFYDRFRGRIMFPISDSSGRVIAFSGRSFGVPPSADGEVAKYLNSPETVLFNKSSVLFGIDKAKSAIRTRGYSIVVEGQMDLIMSHQAGFTNTVAVSGTAFSDKTSDESHDSNTPDTNEAKINNLGLIKRLSSNIILSFDGDSAGIRAASRAAMIALALEMQVKVAILPEGKDPADVILENSEKWKDIIKNSVDIISFHLSKICDSTNDMRARGKKIREIVFPFLSMIKSAIERSSYIALIHKHTGIPERAIIEDFDSYEKVNSVAVHKEVEQKIEKIKDQSRREQLERKLFGIIFWQEKENTKEDFLSAFSSFDDALILGEFQKIREIHEPFSDVLAFEAEMWYGGEIKAIERDMGELVINLEEEILNERLVILLNEINNYERQGKAEMLAPLLEEYQKKVSRIEHIKNSRSK